ncbi:MAG: GtrA family protein [Bryobacterales bacterium]|nr:GtrA family protein [Bryobacterales bacterium]MBV9397455.1 GtrA family protein [Bryobacterales bacterium]
MTRQGSRFVRFSLVGLIGAAVQLLLESFLTNQLGLASVAATPLAVEIVILHNFAWHERFTWSDHCMKCQGQIAGRLLRFHAGNGLISLAGNTMLMYWLVQRLRVPEVPAAAAGIVLCSAANFVLADRWVYDAAHKRA